ncbi:MAG: glycosyltransferase family 4 protein [Alphaproteobacteria bacterium]|nr:glycosyltransferase family 4 protein [Alphaproteobacteria bacterium]
MNSLQPSSTTFVVGVGPIAPPIHGAASGTEAVLDYFRPRLRLLVANTSRGTSEGFRKHLVKAARTLRAMAYLLVNASRSQSKVLYMAADGGRGILYNILVALMGRMCGYRIFLHHHSFAYIDRKSTLMAILSSLVGRSGVHIALCEVMASGLRARYPVINNTMLLFGSAYVAATPRLAPRGAADIRVGFLSNLIIEKGLDTCIVLLRAALQEGLPVRLIIAGRPPDQRAVDLVEVAKAEFGDALEYLGPVSEEEKTQFYLELDVFAFPTRYINEAQPRAVLDALGFGVPVLTVARSCIASDVGPDAGLCVPPSCDFVENVMPVLRTWCNDRQSLARSSYAAAERARVLHNEGVRQLAAIVGEMKAGLDGREDEIS